MITLYWKCDNFDKVIKLFANSKLKLKSTNSNLKSKSNSQSTTKNRKFEPCIKVYQAMIQSVQCYGKRGEGDKVAQSFDELKRFLIDILNIICVTSKVLILPIRHCHCH